VPGMDPVLRRRSTCRLGDAADLAGVIGLVPTPPANAFVSKERLAGVQEAYPLDVHLCRSCGHVQLLDVVDPGVLFGDYVYVSGTSPVFVEHFRRYAERILAVARPAPGALVVDIGSNDGTLLRFFREGGMRVLGIDPAREIARRATESGVETLPVFFTSEVARELRKERGAASVIAANNVFAHIDDLPGVAEGIRALLGEEGVFVFEVSYLMDVLEKTLFDTIYHEHLSYHSLKPLVSFFPKHGMRVFDVERVPSHGGSLRCLVKPAASARPVMPSVQALLEAESRAGLDRRETFERFSASIEAVGRDLDSLLRDIRRQGKTVAGYGAPAKATTLLHQFGLGEFLEYIVDDSPLKQDLYTPGQHIPVGSSETLKRRKPDYLLILAWNFAQPIMDKCQGYARDGGKFIVPLPKCEVFPR
jgi:SAM-dependent methyltransferase